MARIERIHIAIRGAVQGVGFRPFVYRVATGMGLAGWVTNSPEGVFIEADGPRAALEEFLARIGREKPPRSFIQSMEHAFYDAAGFDRFEIRASTETGRRSAIVLPDIATCPDCLKEVFDPGDRRYRYPFINCTNCGPRFSIIRGLPYDRSRTTMERFVMCADCRREYEDPLDRRYHAQPNGCPACGPHLELWTPQGEMIARDDDALLRAAESIRAGRILAIKGIGGFHLMADARNEEAAGILRQRKRRPEKPLALLFPSMEQATLVCDVSEQEKRLLLSPEAPIVLLPRSGDRWLAHWTISPSVAPGNPCLGIMLPSNPLHHLLMRELGFPVIATSGNISDEPMCTDEHEALKRLGGIADLFLIHDRPIERHMDDSIVRTIMGREMVVRRARGYAPLPVRIVPEADGGSIDSSGAGSATPALLAVGAHLKNSVAFAIGHDVFISQHIGDLETVEAFDAFQGVIGSLGRLYDARPDALICDLHPSYLSSQYARSNGAPVRQIQHHYAHVASCMADNRLSGRVLGAAWDGVGYGTDGTIWGGEFLLTGDHGYRRVGSFRRFRLPGGGRAITEPRRSAIGLLYEILGPEVFERADILPVNACTREELAVFRKMLLGGISSPVTSSAGRLFDALAAILGLRQRSSFEGQAAMDLEFIIDGELPTADRYAFRLEDSASDSSGREPSSILIIDWEPMVREIMCEMTAGTPLSVISARFHNTLAEIIVAVSGRIGEPRVVLTGGCFQNRYLTERTIERLKKGGFHPYWHQRVPPNDGGIALGQIYAHMRSCRADTSHGFPVEQAAR